MDARRAGRLQAFDVEADKLALACVDPEDRAPFLVSLPHDLAEIGFPHLIG
jgi:hypothetical protein